MYLADFTSDMPAIQPISPSQNFINAALIILIGLPPIFFGYYFTHHCQSSLYSFNERQADEVWWMDKLSIWENTCRFGGQHPLLLVNILLFIFLDIHFWLASLLQNSTWLIDPYWTLIPLLIGQFYWIHPYANGNPIRSWLVMIILWIWSIRLTYSYFRREEWNFGGREDWRFAELRRKYPNSWWWSQFFLAYVSQHLFLFGITTPLYAAFHDPNPRYVGPIDILCLAISLFGIALASHSDTVLREFMSRNEIRELSGQPKILLLNEGPWKYSRHPNYVGEQLHWWGLALLAWYQGHPWMMVGALLNSICLWVATGMVEERMLKNETRRAIYQQYQRDVDVWIPFRNFPDAIKAMLPQRPVNVPARHHRE
jgi:steroid 5-alpha reductase family enzyme